MTIDGLPYPHILRRGELIRKVLIVTIEVAADDLRQVTYLSRRQPEGTFACCYHVGRIEGGVFLPETADCLEAASAEEADAHLEAVLTGSRASARDRFLSHTIYDLTKIETIEAQLDFLASHKLSYLARAEPA